MARVNPCSPRWQCPAMLLGPLGFRPHGAGGAFQFRRAAEVAETVPVVWPDPATGKAGFQDGLDIAPQMPPRHRWPNSTTSNPRARART